MRITVIDVEGTPAEIEQTPSIAVALQRLGRSTAQEAQEPTNAESADAPAASDVATSRPTGSVPGVPREGQDAVRAALRRNPSADAWMKFMDAATLWPNVGEAHGVKRKGSASGAPLDYTRYLRLRKQGSQVGGFAYTWAESGRVNLRLRLSADDLARVAPSARRIETGHREYRVNIDVREDNVDEAIALARRAYDLT